MTAPKITFEEIAAYAAGELTGTDRQRVADAIASDAGLASRVARIAAAIATMRTDSSTPVPPESLARYRAVFREQYQEAPATSLFDLVEQVARLLFDSRTQPAVAGLRGVGAIQVVYEADGVLIELGIEGAGETRRVTGQISAESTPTTAVLRNEGDCVELELDEQGWFTADVPAGQYDLRVLLQDRVVTATDISIG